MPRILLIDDDQTMRRALRIALEKSGHEVAEAGNGCEALVAYRLRPADLVIADLIMPEMEGVETIRALRKLRPELPIIAISGGGRGSPENYLHLAQQFGAAKTFAKPFDFGILDAAVTSLLGGAGGPGKS
jgi:DNA-binding response OmpR family regulator